jgi:hypothetical protein
MELDNLQFAIFILQFAIPPLQPADDRANRLASSTGFGGAGMFLRQDLAETAGCFGSVAGLGVVDDVSLHGERG